MDIGRNEPCPCGSGKKYKRRCGAPKTDPLALAAGAVRATQDTAEAKVVRLIRREYGDDAFDDAWDEFDFAEGDRDPGRDELDLFDPWVLYDWEPWDEDRHSRRSLEVRLPPASTAAALPLLLSLIHLRMRAGATLNSRESAAAVVSPDRMRSTDCRLNSVVKIRRPSDFLSKSPISAHLYALILGLKSV